MSHQLDSDHADIHPLRPARGVETYCTCTCSRCYSSLGEQCNCPECPCSGSNDHGRSR